MSHPLQNYIGYRMLQVIKLQRHLAETALNELGLYTGQEMILFCLWEQEGLTQSDIVSQVFLDPSTVTKSLQRLQQAGVVERRQDAEDARVTRVYLTPKGRELEAPVRQIWRDLDAQTGQGLSEVEKALLLRLLEQIQTNLSK
jgi:DNA-binding MarR family transcriptional regulator